MFELMMGEEVKEFGSRSEAIQAARELSSEYRGTIAIMDGDKRERMTYQGGELVSYDYETRRH